MQKQGINHGRLIGGAGFTNGGVLLLHVQKFGKLKLD